jgi:hypothetical protein
VTSIALIGHPQPGQAVPLQDLDHAEFVRGCRSAGQGLRRLHGRGVEPDRRWGWRQEVDTLRAGVDGCGEPALIDLIEPLAVATAGLAGLPPVAALGDCRPGRVLVTPTGDTCWAGPQHAVTAPATMDVGGFTAHLVRDGLTGLRPAAVVAAARAAFLVGSGRPRHSAVLAGWELLALTRLALAALTRGGDPGQARLLAATVAGRLDGPMAAELARRVPSDQVSWRRVR